MLTPMPPSGSALPPATTAHAPPAALALRFSFHGTGTAFFALMLKNMLLTLITLGIYLPWSKTERRKYLWQNVEIHGHRLRYHGTGRELFMGYLKVVAAYAVFIGTPALVGHFAGKQIGSFVQIGLAFVILPIIPFAIWGSRRYLLSRTSWRGIRFRLEGGAGPYARAMLVGYLLTIVTLGFYAPIWLNRMHRIMTNATALGTQRFEYRGSDKDAFRIGVKGFVLTLLTLGIYSFWYQAELSRFQMANTWFDRAHGELTLTGGEIFMLTIVQVLGLTLTLGLAFPWVTAFTLRFMLERMRFVGEVDFKRIYQVDAQGNAAADGLADALDVGLAV